MEWWYLLCKIAFFSAWLCWMWCLSKAHHSMCRIFHFCEWQVCIFIYYFFSRFFCYCCVAVVLVVAIVIVKQKRVYMWVVEAVHVFVCMYVMAKYELMCANEHRSKFMKYFTRLSFFGAVHIFVGNLVMPWRKMQFPFASLKMRYEMETQINITRKHASYFYYRCTNFVSVAPALNCLTYVLTIVWFIFFIGKSSIFFPGCYFLTQL